MYSLCQAFLNGAITSNDFAQKQTKLLDNVSTLIAAEIPYLPYMNVDPITPPTPPVMPPMPPAAQPAAPVIP